MKKINNYRKLYTKIIFIVFSTLLLFISSSCKERQTPEMIEEYGEKGKIAFLWYPEDKDGVGKLILMDGKGNKARYIGLFSGSLAFSPDGKQIAIGCPVSNQYGLMNYNKTEICLIDIDKFISFTENRLMEPYENKSSLITRIPLPEQCQEYQEWKGELYVGINSIDWSPNSDKLLLVCGDRQNSEVCSINLDGDSYCWNDKLKQDVFRAVWSPIDENIVLVSSWNYSPTEIYLATAEGEIIQNLKPGWNAEWSPDGEKIAYIAYMEDPETQSHYYGIAVINRDGTDHQYYYLPELGKKKSYLFLDGFDTGVPTRLAWSPDGQYIAISGTNSSLYNYGIFRLDVNSGEVYRLVDSDIFGGILYEPDWGP